MSVRIVTIDISGEWNGDDDILTEKLHAAIAQQPWVAEVCINNIQPYGPDDEDDGS